MPFVATPISDEDAGNIIMTPTFKDQIASLTRKHWIDLAKNLEEGIRESTIEKIKHQHKREYERCYEMLTVLMEEFRRNDWLFLKHCYKNAEVEVGLIQRIELLIKNYMQGKQNVNVFLCKVRQR